ncbi:MAG: type I methionyl aminopeptidase [Succinivibrio sp.]
MDITLKSQSEIEKMRIVGAATARVLEMIEPFVVPGVTTEKLDDIMNDYMEKELGAKSADKGYQGYPKATCISINEVVCHGIPSPSTKLREGDIVNIDVTVLKDGYHGDSSRMFIVGKTSKRNEDLCTCAQQSMYEAIRQVRPGANLKDIGNAIQKVADKYRFSIVRDYCGHGIGRGFHEDPQVLHYRNDFSVLLEEGMCFTIEPMINAGTWKCKVNKKDGWTVTTADKQPSAQYEHTLLVIPGGVEVLTLRKDEDFPRIITN